MSKSERINYEIWWLTVELEQATLTPEQRATYEGVLEGIRFTLSLDQEKVYS